MLVLAIITVSTTTAAALSCSCGDICVNPSGWWRNGGALNPSTTPIQAAVSNANAGETICVAAGSYTENVDITKQLTLRGEGADAVTVTAASSSDHVFDVGADYVNISGFNVTGATSHGRAGIYLYGANNCNISDNTASNNNRGIYLSTSNNNMLLGNTASNNGNGIYMYGSSNNTLDGNSASNNNRGIYMQGSSDGNTLDGNSASNNRYGIYMYYSNNDNTFSNNTASSNNHHGIYATSSSNNTLLGNVADSNNGDGIYMYGSSNNTLANNTADSNDDYGIYLRYSSNNMLLGNTANSNAHYGIYLDNAGDNNITCNWVHNNTDAGFYLTSGSTGNTIAWNNIVANGELQTDGSYHYQFNNYQSDGVDAINNFWGAEMNNDTIDASIYDDEEGQAEVNFYPFETEPVPCAPASISEKSPAFTTVDAVIALRIAVGSCPTDLRYDVSGDGHVTSLDALMIAMDARTG